MPYRSLNFVTYQISKAFYQNSAQVNFPNNFDFTRITEFKFFLDQQCYSTKIAVEYPQEYKKDINEPFYPFLNMQAKNTYHEYKKLAKQEENTIFLGRLGEYKYLNMDQVVEHALNTFNKLSFGY